MASIIQSASSCGVVADAVIFTLRDVSQPLERSDQLRQLGARGRDVTGRKRLRYPL